MQPSRHLQLILLWGLCFFFGAACGTSNPLIGHWKVDEKESLQGVGAGLGLVGMDEIEFRPDKMIMGSVALAVTYEVDEDRVIVTNKQSGAGQVFRVLGKNRLKFEAPMGLSIVYRRLK